MKRLLIIIGVVVLVAVIAAGFSIYTNYRLNSAYSVVKIGDSENRVIELMGKPGKILFPTDPSFSSRNIEGCTQEYCYNAIILPEQWIIGFDKSRKVTNRNHYIM